MFVELTEITGLEKQHINAFVCLLEGRLRSHVRLLREKGELEPSATFGNLPEPSVGFGTIRAFPHAKGAKAAERRIATETKGAG